MDETEARIRQDIEETRAAMSEKIGLIQDRMEEAVEETGATVARFVNGVMEQVKRVQDLVEHITSTADDTVTRVQAVTQQTTAQGRPGSEMIADLSQHPWVMMGTAVLVGYILAAGDRTSAARGAAPITSSTQVAHDNLAADKPRGKSFDRPTNPASQGVSAPAHTGATAPANTMAP